MSKLDSLNKKLQILSQIGRFLPISKKKNVFVLPKYITALDLTESILILIHHEQKERYSEEIQPLEIAQQVKPKSRICKLYPFLENGFLCIGGRCVVC